jgi:hypothetical protein
MKPCRLFLIFAFLLASCSRTGLPPNPSSTPLATAQGEILATSTISTIPAATKMPGPSGLTIEIYALASPPSTEPLTFTPAQGTQEQILLNHQKVRDQDPSILLDEANKALQPFSYHVDTNPPSDITTANVYTITKNSSSIFNQKVFGFLPVSVNADGTDFMMVVDAADGGYLISTKGVQKGGMGLGAGFPPPVFLNNDVLTATEAYTDTANGSSGNVTVNLGSREIFTTAIGSPSPVTALRGLWSDGKNWTLEVARAKGNADNFQVIGEIYQNGISLNLKYGYQSTFEYQLLSGKPFYFYQKNDQIGISYDGQETPLGFDEIPHYGCCSGAELNPRHYTSLVDFFARKSQVWYFVEILKMNLSESH